MTYGEKYDWLTMVSSKRDADIKLDDDIDMRAVRQYEYQQRDPYYRQRNRKSHDHER